jgi:hypothetical protein
MEQHAPDSALRYGGESAQPSLPPSPPPSTATAVRRVLEAFRTRSLVEERLAEAARVVSGEARDRGLRAEQMIVEVKRALGAGAAPRLDSEVAREAAERLIGLCIGAYYARGESARRPDDC